MSADNDNNWWGNSTIREYSDKEIDNLKIHCWMYGFLSAILCVTVLYVML